MTRAPLAAGAAGLAFMAVELLASRWLAPIHGFTLTTWSFLISATLLGGSFGAWLGGRLSRGAQPSGVGSTLGVAAAWIAVLPLLAPPLVTWSASFGASTGAALASLALVLPAVVPLTAVVPLLVATEGLDARGVGRLVAASTLGSLLGTLGTALLGVPDLGLAASAWVTAGVLLAVAATFLLGARRGVVLGAALGALAAGFANRDAGSADHVETSYGRLTIEQGPGSIDILSDGILQAALPRSRLRPLDLLRRRQYVELLPYLRPWGRRAVVVGLGGGQFGEALARHDVEVTWVEMNRALVELLRRRGLAPAGGVRVGDGRAVLRRLEGRVAFVVLDAFRGEAPAAHLLTREALAEARDRLEDRGVLGVHLIGRPSHRVTAAVGRTLLEVFAHVLAVRSGAGEELQDLWLFASDGPLAVPPARELLAAGWRGNEIFIPETSLGRVLTDDLNPIDRWNEPLARALRARSCRTRP